MRCFCAALSVGSWPEGNYSRGDSQTLGAFRHAIDLPNEKCGRKNPRVGDRVQITYGPFAGHSGLCTQISRQQFGVLLLNMFKAQRQVRLRRDGVELV
jgi:hypothetical protein